MPAPMGQSSGGVGGPMDPRKKESSMFHYFKAIQSDLNKRFGNGKNVKKSAPAKEK